MASPKFIASIVLFVSFISAPIAHAQLGIGNIIGNIIGGLGGGRSGGGILDLIKIDGNISCSLDGSPSVVDGVATPAFINALVQLQCRGNVVSSARTNADGVFSMLLNPALGLLSRSPCNIVVKTPLSTCNVNLPVGCLVSDILDFSELHNINIVPGTLKFVKFLN